MGNIKKMFVEFKSIFASEDLLKENEEHANIVTATTMMIAFIIGFVVALLNYFGIFKLRLEMMNRMLITSSVLLLLPAIICFIRKGKDKWIKQLLFVCFTLILAMTDALLKMNVALIIIFPIILSARYFNKKFTIGVATITIITFMISTFMSVNVGPQDISSYNYIIPKGTTITINDNLRQTLDDLNIDKTERLHYIFIQIFLPRLFLFLIATFACCQIAQAGKNMIEKQHEITKKGARIETELNLANAIQQNMLPSVFPPFPEHKEIDIYATMTPAKEVGGDFYDMFLLDDNHLAICMADVSGKGVPASLLMMISKILIKNVTTVDKEANKVLTRVNNMLCDGNKANLFVTAWLGILDLTNGKLEFVNAGHNPPLLYSSKAKRFEYLKTKPNLLLAWKENINYRNEEIYIEPGDRLFLYTDGVTESTNNSNELYGEERLKAFLNSNIELGAEETIKKVKEDIDKFTGNVEQFDDITMLELIYKNNKTDNSIVIQKDFKADARELPNIQEFARKELEKYNCDSEIINKIELVIEEIFANIVNYAYKDKTGNCVLKIQFDNASKVNFVFEDEGIPFNPLEKKDIDITTPLKDRGIGGYGIFLNKKIMDKVEYKYENNKNILRIIKNL